MGAEYLWKALVSEFIATFIIVFAIASAVSLASADGGTGLGGATLVTSSLAYGIALLVVIYIFGKYSGAHANPAVSFGFAVAGQMNWGLMIGYWIAQLLGAIAAAALVAYFFGTEDGAGASIGTLTNTDAWKAVLLEAFITFFLVLGYLFVYRNPWLAMVNGLAIGLILTFVFIAGDYLTGASANPARSFGPAIFSNNLGSIWIYIVGPLLGALVAALIYKLFTVDFNCCDKLDECGNPILDECGNRLKECKVEVVDNCGNVITDCNGPVYETHTVHERRLHHMQETPMTVMGGIMSAHGLDPHYVKQEIGHAMKETVPDGKITNPQGVVKSTAKSLAVAGGNLANPGGLPSLSSLSPNAVPRVL
jgi:MIP family channel proteins